ncbi:MAG: hypothetical protein JWM86_1654 [Thermoleophilia bacterium]|nr:hypothetical protein [Thermoleophilia bacterium]
MELIVVVLIIMVIGGFGISSILGSRTRSTTTSARTVAVQLSEAASQFQRDHGGRVPGDLGTTAGRADWDARMTSPVDRANGNRTYLKHGAVEALSDGRLSLEAQGGRVMSAGTPSAAGRIRYDADTVRNVFVVVAFARTSGTMRATCWASPFGAAATLTLRRANGGPATQC